MKKLEGCDYGIPFNFPKKESWLRGGELKNEVENMIAKFTEIPDMENSLDKW